MIVPKCGILVLVLVGCWDVGMSTKISEYTEGVWEDIETAVRKAQRDLRRGVFPRDVQPRLPFEYRAEGSLRRDMLAMYEAGWLVRIGGYGARRGYRLPSRMERLAYSLNRGMFPYRTEYVQVWGFVAG